MSENATRVTLVLPDLFSLPQMSLPDERLPALELMLARGERQQHGAHADLRRQLAALLGLNPRQRQTVPVAALSLLGVGQDPGERWCLCADPIQMMPNRDHLLVLGQQHLQITDDEAEDILADLNRHFADDGLLFFRDQAGHWLLSSAVAFSLKTTPLDQAVGQNVRHVMPQGEDARRWQGWMNETQMLLHQHPVNEQRRQQGRAEINSLWFWGQGCLPSLSTPVRQAVWGGDSFVRGLAAWGQSDHFDLPADARPVIDGPAGLVVFPLPGSTQKDPWHDDLAGLERNWCQPLLEALRQGRIECLVLETGQQAYHLSRKGLRRFWQRPRAFRDYYQNHSEG